MRQQEKYDWMVYVGCMTFNHAPYIVDAMNGFTMQETNFPFVCAVVDDASTDGEQEIIKQYLNEHFDLEDKNVVRQEETDDYVLTFARHKTNLNCYFAVLYLKYNHYSIKKPKVPYLAQWRDNAKYYAICEGDDYWCDPEKLQKQVDFLEKNEGYGMVYTPYRLQNDVTGYEGFVRTSVNILHDDNFKWRILEQKVQIGTCTVMIRRKLQITIRAIDDDYKGFLMGDTQTWFNAARLSNIGYIPDVTGVYRKQYTGATATFDPSRRAKFIRGCLDLHLHLAYKYGAPRETVERIKSLFGFTCFNLYYRIGDYKGAEKLNHDWFNDNKIISFINNIVKMLKLKQIHGLGTILRSSVKLGLIQLG